MNKKELNLRQPFPCNGCGKCCQNVDKSTLTKFLDRGDGICKNFDESTKLCKIYEYRPLVCRVEDFYIKNLSDQYQWDDFIKINLDICSKL